MAMEAWILYKTDVINQMIFFISVMWDPKLVKLMTPKQWFYRLGIEYISVSSLGLSISIIMLIPLLIYYFRQNDGLK